MKWRVFIVLTGVLLTVFLVFLFFSIKINTIECKSQNGDCNSKVTETLKKFEGKKIFEVKKGVGTYLESEVLVESSSSQFKFPSKIEALIVEKKPAFSITNNEKKNFAIVDPRGFVLSHSHIPQKPTLISGSLPEPGVSVSDDDMFLLSILGDLSRSFQISEGTKSPEGLLIELKSGLNVIFPLEGDREALLGSLVLLYSKIQKVPDANCTENSSMSFRAGECNNEDGKSQDLSAITTIDLRYKNPVLKK